MTTPFLSIIIPAHNEEKRLPQTMEQVINFCNLQKFECEVLIVENASTDRTLETASEYARTNSSIIKVIHDDLPGKGRAVKKGMLSASGKYLFFADADFSMPAGEISRFIPPAVDVPIAIASRETPGAIRYHEPGYRHLTGRIFNGLIRLLVLPGLHDTQCGFKMFRAEEAKVLFQRQTLTGWAFDVELLYIAGKHNYPILEIPIPWYFNPESKVNVLRDSWRMLLEILTIRQNDRRGLYD
ncbi:MAG: dolichyl-phosphate beta-glucosyltransferase [Chloroflexota bacterium]